MDGELYM